MTVHRTRFGAAADNVLARRAEQILDFRARRAKEFGRAMFGEPAWDMLLAIYIAEQRGERPTIPELAAVSGDSPSIAIRWLNFLIEEGLAAQKVHSARPDRLAVQMTDRSREILERYLGETLAEWPA